MMALMRMAFFMYVAEHEEGGAVGPETAVEAEPLVMAAIAISRTPKCRFAPEWSAAEKSPLPFM